MCALFAAMHPERSIALILMGAFPREMWAPDYPAGTTEDDFRYRLALLDEDDWATAMTRAWLERVAPDVLRDPDGLRWYTSYVRRGASPAANRAFRLMNAGIDVRDVLPTIGVPTLVLYRAKEAWREGSRLMGAQIPGARVVELPGQDHLPWEGDSDALLDEIEAYMSGVHQEAGPERVLATLLVARIAAPAAEAGHQRFVRAQLARFRGREAEVAGDRVLATFDGPARAVRCAAAIGSGVEALGLTARTGVHTGEVEQADGGVHGIAVQITTQIAAAARPGEVLVSSTVKDIVAGSGIAFDERGERELDGVPGSWRLFTATT
jgi:hypothetical protein